MIITAGYMVDVCRSIGDVVKLTLREVAIVEDCYSHGESSNVAAQWIMGHRINIREGKIQTPNAGSMSDYVDHAWARALLVMYNRKEARAMRDRVRLRLGTPEWSHASRGHDRINKALAPVEFNRGRHIPEALKAFERCHKGGNDARLDWYDLYSDERRSANGRSKSFKFIDFGAMPDITANFRCVLKPLFEFKADDYVAPRWIHHIDPTPRSAHVPPRGAIKGLYESLQDCLAAARCTRYRITSDKDRAAVYVLEEDLTNVVREIEGWRHIGYYVEYHILKP